MYILCSICNELQNLGLFSCSAIFRRFTVLLGCSDGYLRTSSPKQNQSVWVSFGLKTDPQREPKTNNHSNGLIQHCPYELGSSSQPKRLCIQGEGQPHARRSTFDFSVGHFGTTMERGHLKIETANRGFPITSMATSASDFRVTCGFMLQQL